MNPWILGIAGGSGSGKSVLAQRLSEALGPARCAHIAHDDYYHPLPASFRDRPGDYNFDDPVSLETDLLVQHLDLLRSGRAVRVPQYDFASHDRVGARLVEPRSIVLIEGILLLCSPQVRDRLDLAVFVHAPAPVRLERRVVRDVAERGRQEAWVRERFARHVEPMHQQHVQPTRHLAHLVVDGQGNLGLSVQSVLSCMPGGHRPG